MKLGRFLTTLGIGALAGMLLAPKKGSELREELKGKGKETLDSAKEMTVEDYQKLISETIDSIKKTVDEFDVDEFKDTAGEKLGDIKTKLEQLATSVKSSDEYASFKESVAKVSDEVTTKFKEIKTKVQDKDFNVLQELDDAMDDIEDELDVIIEDLKD